jgi:hypothetical protein
MEESRRNRANSVASLSAKELGCGGKATKNNDQKEKLWRWRHRLHRLLRHKRTTAKFVTALSSSVGFTVARQLTGG